jgi:hypothetical protein
MPRGSSWLGHGSLRASSARVLRDYAVLVGVVVAFAALVTAHVALAVGLARRRSAWHALVALVLVPLAPWWGWKARMHARGVIWVAAAVAYAAALAMSLRA